MATVEGMALSLLYEQDETAWLEAMSALAASGRYEQMDHPHLSEYLADMSNRDRREVFSRLVVLLRSSAEMGTPARTPLGLVARARFASSGASCGSCAKAPRCATMPRRCWPTRITKRDGKRPTRPIWP